MWQVVWWEVVCGQVVCEHKLCVTGEGDGSGRRRRRTGCRTKNKNPTQRCGEQWYKMVQNGTKATKCWSFKSSFMLFPLDRKNSWSATSWSVGQGAYFSIQLCTMTVRSCGKSRWRLALLSTSKAACLMQLGAGDTGARWMKDANILLIHSDFHDFQHTSEVWVGVFAVVK